MALDGYGLRSASAGMRLAVVVQCLFRGGAVTYPCAYNQTHAAVQALVDRVSAGPRNDKYDEAASADA